MSDAPADTERQPGKLYAAVAAAGDAFVGFFSYIGGLAILLGQVNRWIIRAMLRQVRFGNAALFQQIVRVGVRSVPIITLVSACIGMILVLQMAPPLEEYGAKSSIANINAVAVLRELGPLISAIVLTGFAGAAIAAELGTMVVGEEIEALEAMALNPVRFLVVPRVTATMLGLVFLAVFADIVAIVAGGVIGVTLLDIPIGIYKANTLDQAQLSDFLTGIFKAGVFGFLIGIIACYNGLRVSGGAAGVGHATTKTVVDSIVSIIFADLTFTALFYALGWN